jgi:hypothetical protein
LRFGLGHPVDYHPVSDVMDPTNQSKITHQAELPVVPSAARFGGPSLLVKDQSNNMAFCDSCHKNR